MKILMVTNNYNQIGGIERVITNLSNALIKAKFQTNHKPMQVDILSIYKSQGKIPWKLHKGIKLFFYSYPFGKEELKQLPFLPRMCVNIKILLFYKPKFFIKKHRILKTDEILKHFFQDFIDKTYAKYDFVIDQSSWLNYPASKSLPHTKVIRLWHNGIKTYEKFFGGQPPNSDKYDVWMHLTNTAAKMWNNHRCIEVIPNFLPHIPQSSANPTQKVVLSVGRLSEEKGFSRLLDIWQLLARDEDFKDEFKQWRLIIVGDGVLKGDLERKVREFALTNVRLKPFTKDIESEYLAASIYAMCSFYESFGMVLAEASSCALPCIAFDVKTGPSDIIESEKSGFLVADNDLSGFANALKILMSDENLRREFGKNAKKIVSEKFSKEAVLEKWLNLFEELQKNEEKCAK